MTPSLRELVEKFNSLLCCLNAIWQHGAERTSAFGNCRKHTQKLRKSSTRLEDHKTKLNDVKFVSHSFHVSGVSECYVQIFRPDGELAVSQPQQSCENTNLVETPREASRENDRQDDQQETEAKQT